MLALGILPVACFAEQPVTARITGGVFQDFAPSRHHVEHVLAPLLARMGAGVQLRLLRAGYVPGGEGVIEIRVDPVRGSLTPLSLTGSSRSRGSAWRADDSRVSSTAHKTLCPWPTLTVIFFSAVLRRRREEPSSRAWRTLPDQRQRPP